MIDPLTVSRIMDAARIEEVVSDYVTLRRRGVNLIGLCPFHDEKTGSFTVSPAKGIFKCFGCGKGGNAVHFIMEYEQVSYYEALKLLAKKYNIEVQERELTDEEKNAQNDRESMFMLNDFARKFFTEQLYNTEEGQNVGMAYFRERGFRDDMIRKFQLGYCPERRDAFNKAALGAGYKTTYIEKTGLAYANDHGQMTDRFHGRVIFPVHTLSGKVVAFGGRILKKDNKIAKYVNSPESEIYHKSNELYGIFFAKQAIVKQDCCYLVEGYTDVISMHQAGIENVVASSGTSLTTGQIRLLHRFTENITILYDGDNAGIKASLRGIDMLLEEGLNIKVLLLPDGEDPDSFARKNNASDFIAYIQQHQVDFIRFKTNLLLQDAGNDPIKRSQLIQDIVRSISVIPSNIVRQVYIKDCSNLLDIDEQTLIHAINNLKIEKKEKDFQKQKSEEARQSMAANETDKSKEKLAEDIPEALQATTLTTASKFESIEREIIQTLVRHGEKELYVQPETGEPVSVGKYIIHELEMDGIVFNNPLYMQIIDEFKAHCHDEGFVAEKFYKFHINDKISQLAIDLIAEKYTLSKIHYKTGKKPTEINQLHESVPRLIYDLKIQLIQEKQKQLTLLLKQAGQDREIIAHLMQLKKIEFQLSKAAGRL